MRKITSGMAALALCVSLSVPTSQQQVMQAALLTEMTTLQAQQQPPQPTKPRLPPQIAQKQKPS